MRFVVSAFALSMLACMSGGALADEKAETAVRLFLGIGNGSAVSSARIWSDGRDVVVDSLELPLNGLRGSQPAKTVVKQLRFVGVDTESSGMSFSGVTGSGIMVTGEEPLAARSMTMGPAKAKDLGVVAFAVDGDISATFSDIVAPSKNGTIRVSSYSLALSGDPASAFTQSARFDGVRSDQLKLGSASEGIQAEMAVSGDGRTRELGGTVVVRQVQFGEVRAEFSMARIEPTADRLSILMGFGFFAGAPELKRAAVSFTPAEPIRTMLMFMTSEQRDRMVEAVQPFIRGQLGLDAQFASVVSTEVGKFLSAPVRISVGVEPPVPISVAGTKPVGGNEGAEGISTRLGLSIKAGQ
ncbi:MAG: hypothetical protein DI537_05060 [Stutzerimonas stutzeri]|nr:MAG: hypothetical protein DI537_05060 [Stutzerimonas stutzeri]